MSASCSSSSRPPCIITSSDRGWPLFLALCSSIITTHTDDRPLPYNERASRAARHLHHALATPVNQLLAQHPERMPDGTPTPMAGWLLTRLDRWARLPNAAHLADQLANALDQAAIVVDLPEDDRRYLGICGELHAGHPCPGTLYAKPTDREVTCNTCGTTHDVEHRRDYMLSIVGGYVLTAAECSRALSSLDRPVAPATIRQWAARKRLTPAGMIDGSPTYRVREVRELIEQSLDRTRA